MTVTVEYLSEDQKIFGCRQGALHWSQRGRCASRFYTESATIAPDAAKVPLRSHQGARTPGPLSGWDAGFNDGLKTNADDYFSLDSTHDIDIFRF